MSPSAVVQFEAAGFAYPNRPPLLDGLNLSVEPGEIVVFVGRSGAGKSTILKLVNRLILPASGAVRVEGRDTREWDGIRLRRRIGYVLQDVGLFQTLKVAHLKTARYGFVAPLVCGGMLGGARPEMIDGLKVLFG